MSEGRRIFIEENREALSRYLRLAGKKDRYASGFGFESPRDTISKVLNDDDVSSLPFALLHIFWDQSAASDRDFVLKSFEWLFEFNSKNDISDPDIAYVFAYCLHFLGSADDSAKMIDHLVSQCYPPALATIGDAHLAHRQIRQAVESYSHAIDHGNFRLMGRRNQFIARNLPFFRSSLFRLFWFFSGMGKMFRAIGNQRNFECMGYLDFYGAKKHLDSFWRLPRSERVDLLRQGTSVYETHGLLPSSSK